MGESTRNNVVLSQLWLFLSVVAIGIALVLTARPAYARDYSIDKVNIDATVQTDGTLEVNEERTFDFDGSFHGVYWELPAGTYEGRSIDPEVVSVGEYVNGTLVPLVYSSSGEDGTYSTSDEGSVVRVRVYSAHSDESVTFVITYRDQQLASRWADTSELYWKFVSDGWDVESQDVTCTIHLPVPSGETIDAGNNVRAWGHGSLDASVGFSGDAVVYTVPGVGSDEYAEARIVFPQAWLSQAQASSESRLDSILSQEQQLADEANAQRLRARIIMGVVYAGGVAIVVVSLVVAFRARRKYREGHAPHFTDKYFRDVPSNDHPAVLGALLRDGTPTSQDFSASLMRLTDLGYAELDTVALPKRGLLGRKKGTQACRLTRTRKAVDSPRATGEASDAALAAAADIDRLTIHFAFDEVARKAPATKLEDGSVTDASQLLMSDFQAVAQSSPQAYSDAFQTWQNEVFAACTKRRFFVDEKQSHRGRVVGFGALDFVAAIASVVAGVELGFTLVSAVVIVGLVVAGAICLKIASGFDEVSREAIELRAKLGALRNWLCEFTRLEEAWPRDVVLWNKLLVMAVVLGVADKVIDQLKVDAPEMLQSDAMAPVYGWYYVGPYGPSPLSLVGDSLNAAHSVSVAELAKTSASSASGGGGGFSSGGGGGFGGGGGGGAF